MSEIGWVLGAFALGSGATLLGVLLGLLTSHVARTGAWPIREKVTVPRKAVRPPPEPSMVQLPAPPGAPPPPNGMVDRKNEALGNFDVDFQVGQAYAALVDRMATEGSVLPSVDQWLGDGR